MPLDPSMALDSIATLLAVLRRTELLAPEQLEQIARELAPHFPDPASIAGYLAEVGWLTAYQVQLLLGGQWDDLTVGPYNVLDRLGEGGISEVFKAWDTVRGRVVALKVLQQHLAGKSDMIRQFRRELEAITRLSHPNVVKTFDAHQDGAMHYFAMEFVEGMDLERYVRVVGPLPVEEACDYARQAAQGLQHAHQSGLVHRDIKPANLFLLRPPLPGRNGSSGGRPKDTVVKIIDWGLARCLRDPDETSRPPSASVLELDAEKGSLIGTADYIAPEQARDPRLVDIRADLYSLGCTLFFLLTGKPPFEGPSLMHKLLQHQEAGPPSPRREREDVPEELDALVRKLLAKSPVDRPQIPLLVVTPLRRFCQGSGGANGTGQGPAGRAALPSSRKAPRTAMNLTRPSTQAVLMRPGTTTELVRPTLNGNGQGAYPE
jgi:serine/threonine protein kinase